ncbi:Helix-turn-helix domain protein [Rhodobacteraceae bacterium THAF1]|uniref:helix-turn-helix transcriptional regulator n=1 Tax=Palleronia sp. THAF1 TaxID=2587842 RepID=UPI000F3DDC12|nr:Helix-turn-helix domain protein [Palleronia sp. THAF1]VDC20007.1 Helix-turn-helix domain protein [Rhodobacteraceae bacterium THAF1]
MNTTAMADRLCPKEASTYIGLSVRTLARYRAEGLGPKYLRVGRSIQYVRTAIDEWLLSQEQIPVRENA